MKKNYIYLLPLLLLLYFGAKLAIGLNTPNRGEPMPDFEAELVDGTPFKLSKLRGRYVLIYFWGSWSETSRENNKSLVNLHKKFGEDKLEIVSVALEKSNYTMDVAVTQDGITWKNQVMEKHKLVIFSSLARKFGVSDIPTKFLISPDGVLLEDLTFDEIEDLLSRK